jgi:hypothetical protein
MLRRTIADVEVKSVRKKRNDKAFAQAAEKGLDLDEPIAFCIEASLRLAG